MMNERIKELLVDNKDIFSNGCTESNGEVYIHGSQDNLQKFAVLLIKECIGLVEKDIEPELDGSDYAEHWNMALRSASNEIKQHFGVE